MRKNQAVLSENVSVAEGRLYMAMELSLSKWKLGFSDGSGRPARVVTIEASDFGRVLREVSKAKRKFGLSEASAVCSCYEAGRDGFWIHRQLHALGIDNVVVDPASIEVSRRRRRAKTDRLDALKLVAQLVRYGSGEKRVWSIVRVPQPEDEDARQLHRELDQLKKERAQHRMRIQSLLFALGIRMTAGKGFEQRLESVLLWDGTDIPSQAKQRILRECRRLREVEAQLREVNKQRKALVEDSKSKRVEKARMLMELRGIGIEGGWVLTMEFFGWRQFKNRREVGAAAGLTGMPFNSGESTRDQGISKAGNKRVRSLIVELAWSWLRYQPQSKLSQWFNERFAGGGSRMRRVGIVALSRRLLIDLWRFVEQGVVPEGARFKTAH